MTQKETILNLSVEEKHTGFSTSIADALSRAETELTVLNETVESLNG